jgi:cell division protein FtsW
MAARSQTQSPQSVVKQLDIGSYDWGLLSIVTALLLFGLVMVFSASYPWAMVNLSTPFHYILLQLRWLAVGTVALVIAALIPYTFWERWSVILMGLGLISLMAVIFFGDNRFGATRTLFGGSVQPSEPVKIVVLIYISTWLASKGDRIRQMNYGLIPFGVLMGIVTGLIVAQPDISTTILIVSTATIVFFLAGADLKQLLFGGVIAVITFWLVITRNAYASHRVNAYLNSISDPLGSQEWQIHQATEAIVRGGPLGAGVGNSTEKFPGNLPLSWSDNIYAIIGEELGLLGALVVILLFALFAYRGFRIASQAPDMFSSLLAIGLTSLLTLQAIIHCAVVVAIAPPTGVTLPFISFGGSSLVTSMAATGILLSISRYRGTQMSPRSSGDLVYANFNFGWRDRGTHLPGTRRSNTTQSRPAPSRSATTRRSTGQKRTSSGSRRSAAR